MYSSSAKCLTAHPPDMTAFYDFFSSFILNNCTVAGGLDPNHPSLAPSTIYSPSPPPEARCAPNCPSSWVSDGECDAVCNVAACNLDGGDCANQPACSPGCRAHVLGDGHCDAPCDVAACNYDHGDCAIERDYCNAYTDRFCYAPPSPPSSGDGGRRLQTAATYAAECTQYQNAYTAYTGNATYDAVCAGQAPTFAAAFASTGCATVDTSTLSAATTCAALVNALSPICTALTTCAGSGASADCAEGCPGSWRSDGTCDGSCNVPTCDFDAAPGGTSDCAPPSPPCAPGCPTSWRSDGTCDTSCNVAACNYDTSTATGAVSDCGPAAPDCAPGCPSSWLSDGACDTSCDVAACECYRIPTRTTCLT